MSWISGNYYLNTAQMTNNARIIQAYGIEEGWSPNAICAILGNMQSESTINPGIWESLSVGRGGYGLVQWTPYTKYANWAGAGWQDNGTRELERISYEAANNEQWFYNAQIGMAPPYSFDDFLHDDTTPLATMANYFLWFYEHPANPYQPQRGTQAQYWYDHLDWDYDPDDPPTPPDPDPPDPDPPEPPEDNFPYWILFKFKGRGQIWL